MLDCLCILSFRHPFSFFLTRSLLSLHMSENLRYFNHLMHPVPEQYPALELEYDIDTD